MEVYTKDLLPLILQHNYTDVFLYKFIYFPNICKRQIFNKSKHIKIPRVALWK